MMQRRNGIDCYMQNQQEVWMVSMAAVVCGDCLGIPRTEFSGQLVQRIRAVGLCEICTYKMLESVLICTLRLTLQASPFDHHVSDPRAENRRQKAPATPPPSKKANNLHTISNSNSLLIA